MIKEPNNEDASSHTHGVGRAIGPVVHFAARRAITSRRCPARTAIARRIACRCRERPAAGRGGVVDRASGWCSFTRNAVCAVRKRRAGRFRLPLEHCNAQLDRRQRRRRHRGELCRYRFFLQVLREHPLSGLCLQERPDGVQQRHCVGLAARGDPQSQGTQRSDRAALVAGKPELRLCALPARRGGAQPLVRGRVEPGPQHRRRRSDV